MSSKVILPVLLGLVAVGLMQFSFAEELEDETFIAVDEEKFKQPQSKHNYQQLIISGFIEDYSRGSLITVVIISPTETQTEISTYAARNGEIHMPYHITNDSEIGVHQLILIYHEEEIASTSFEILDNQ
ncbi:hypothetical protein C6990_02615 [Nitrosopumilus sp. b3]|uniref:hypothetical protein n=1 Tax=Nitrosopumilus sp. b3 TaxID=2109909 RepID=UPI0015F59A7B|nr:hypothetical protein [Nitrosopumilus sp. b3]KAF6247810.1 hypothetical protein C6990_02615 [Nitrosopumilus sp. b3]